MPSGATVSITYSGTDITSNVLFETARFQMMANGAPGEFEFTIKDPSSSLSFTTGHEVTLSLNGTLTYGGYVTHISRKFAFPDKTDGVRYWVLRGVDYNVNFDRRVLRNTSDYLHAFPSVSATTMDGDAIAYARTNYIELPVAFDTTNVDNVRYYSDGTHTGAYPQQGSKFRDLIEPCAFRAGAVYYIAPDKHIHYHALEAATSSWGFSDTPNGSTTFKMHDIEVVEDGSVIVNDALIWGGSQWSGTGGTVFSRAQDASSQSTYGHWQQGETHFGEEGYGIQAGVDARATSIVNGPTGADATNQLKGLKYPQWQMHFSWWLHDVPSIPVAGYLFTIALTAFGVTKVLPLRAMTMTFPELDPTGKAYVLIEGDFSLNVSDPYTLWNYVRKNNQRIIKSVVGMANNSSPSTTFGAYGSFTPTLVSGLTYSLPFGYIAGSLLVYDAGKLLTPGTGFTETDNIAGTFTLAGSPTGALYATCRTLHT